MTNHTLFVGLSFALSLLVITLNAGRDYSARNTDFGDLRPAQELIPDERCTIRSSIRPVDLANHCASTVVEFSLDRLTLAGTTNFVGLARDPISPPLFVSEK